MKSSVISKSALVSVLAIANLSLLAQDAGPCGKNCGYQVVTATYERFGTNCPGEVCYVYMCSVQGPGCNDAFQDACMYPRPCNILGS